MHAFYRNAADVRITFAASSVRLIVAALVSILAAICSSYRFGKKAVFLFLPLDVFGIDLVVHISVARCL